MKSTRAIAGIAVAGLALAMAACSSSDSSGGSSDASGASTEGLNLLIGSSGDAETKAVKDAVAEWSSQSGIAATVNVASDLNQQLSQGFAGGNPPDAFYMSNDSVATYASNGSLEPMDDLIENKSDFYPGLVEAFNYEGKLYAVPKDFSTLGLMINKDLWAAAGLTDADIPTTWDQLHAVALKLTSGDKTGLVISPEFARVGAFMAQAGGWIVSEDGKKVTADSPENAKALDFVKTMLADGSLKYSSQVGAGWGGEAFGNESAVMTIEGNWILGALKADYPTVKYKVAELPAGPGGKGTMQFTAGWAIAADSKNKENTAKLINFLTSKEQQLKFSTGFGSIPSIKSAAADWKTQNPDVHPFLIGADYAKSIPNLVGVADVVKDFNSGLQTLATADPAQLLKTFQTNLEAINK